VKSKLQIASKRIEIIQDDILVTEVEETARKLEKLVEIGPFQILEPGYRDLILHGRLARFKMRIGLAKAGPIQIELMQALSGETIYDECVMLFCLEKSS
jgi:hypothetical protein